MAISERPGSRIRQLVAEVFLEEAGDLFGVGLQVVGALDVVCREAAAHVDHLQGDAVFFLEALEDHLDLGNRRVPHVDVALLAADVEGDAVGHQAQLLGQDQQVQGHVRLAAELAAQRPVGAGRAFGEDAHVDGAALAILRRSASESVANMRTPFS